jgi:hypothetical protein
LYFKLNSPGLDISPCWPYQEPVQSEKRYTPQKWAIELMPIYLVFDLILLVVLLKLNENREKVLGPSEDREKVLGPSENKEKVLGKEIANREKEQRKSFGVTGPTMVTPKFFSGSVCT